MGEVETICPYIKEVRMIKIAHVVGARPNFMKAAAVVAALEQQMGVEQFLIHTGQHYDANMSDLFFVELGLPSPTLNLEVGSGSHAQQTAQIMSRFEGVVLAYRPDLVLVYGDVNSTVAAALVCVKLQIPVGHVEAGLRSFDRTMPEEINRLLTDQIADWLFTPSADGDENLLREGIDPTRIYRVGNVMMDTLMRLLPASALAYDQLQQRLNLERYGMVTLHRPANVDDPQLLPAILQTLNQISQQIPLVFPVHPRTRQRIMMQQLDSLTDHLCLCEPIGYLDSVALQSHAQLVITDSGGIQEETTFLGVPCLTLRPNTERPVTVSEGTNILVGQDLNRLRAEVERILAGQGKQGRVPALWDGKAGQRIAQILLQTV